MTKILQTLTLGVLVLTLGIGAGFALHARGGPGDTDLGFARDMQAHHLQAVEMSILASDRASDPAVKLLAFDIESTQNNQVGQMRGWLEAWGESQNSNAKPMSWMGHPVDSTSTMPGMATSREMKQLAETRGPDFDVLYLTLMYEHHHGALDMADYANAHGNTQIVRDFARKVAFSQGAEMDNIEAMLQTRGANIPQLPAPMTETGESSHHMHT